VLFACSDYPLKVGIVSAILTDNPSHHPKVFQVMKKLFRSNFLLHELTKKSTSLRRWIQDGDYRNQDEISLSRDFIFSFFSTSFECFWTYSSHTTFLCHSFNSLDVMKGRASSLVCKVPPSHPKRKPSEWAN